MAEDATYLEVVHEYAHITHAERIGTQQYALLPEAQREQEAFDLVRIFLGGLPLYAGEELACQKPASTGWDPVVGLGFIPEANMISKDEAIELARKYAQEKGLAVADLVHASFERDNWQRMVWEPRGDLWIVALAKQFPPEVLFE